MKHLIVGSAALASILVACGDGTTAPSGPFTLTVTTELQEAIIDLSDEQPYICGYKAVAKTEGGEGGEYADWLGGRLDWMDGDSAYYSFNLTPGDLLDRLGENVIGRNKKQNFTSSASGTDPFDLRLILTARHSSGEILSDSSFVICTFPPDVMSTSNLAGNWTTTWLKWLSEDSIIWQYELISKGGALTFSLSANGTFTGSTTYPNLAGVMETQNVAGTVSISESSSVTRGTATFTFTQGPFGTFTGILIREGDSFFLNVDTGATFDFNRDGVPDGGALEGRFKLR